MTALNKQARQVQRYINYGVDMMEWADGGYVRHSDYLALLKELEAAEKRIAEHNFENRLLANADRDIKALRQRIAELESRTVTLPPRAPENLAACLDGYDKWVIATTFRDTWNACLSEVMRMNAAGIGVKGE
ncbi:hypothetical protein VC838_21975 [Citrobacter freundii]|nr:hypothetical protein [Citrobacter freundii]